MVAGKNKQKETEEELQKRISQKKKFHNTLKILFAILFLSAIPTFIFNPDVSFGPFDVLRQELFKTELILNGEKFSPENFMRAIQASDVRKVKLYVRSGINVDTIGKTGISPLCSAAQTGNKELVDILLNSNANILQKNTVNGLTPPFCSIEGGNIEVLEKFLNQGVSIRIRTERGLSMVQYAALLGREQILSYLLAKGADPNIQNIYGQTALHYAVTQDNSYILNILLSAGALVDVEDVRGNSPISIARALDKQSYVKLLSRYSIKDSFSE